MDLSKVPNANRCHIAFFGRMNAGKSSLINAITNQEVSIVSDIAGTTTDIVKKSMEILPLGPVIFIDTAGIDDESELSKKRIEKTYSALDKTDIAILVVDIIEGLTRYEKDLVSIFTDKKIPYLIVYNKSDLAKIKPQIKENEILVSSKTSENIEQLKEKIALIFENKEGKFIIKDKLNSGNIVVLVIPIDESAPKGRLILPQQLVLREIIDKHAIAICTQAEQLSTILAKITPKLVITDSQVFNKVKDIVPTDISLTSFSILMANYKGNLKTLIDGAKKIDDLKDNDTILISEACTHHRQCNDIGTVKFPKWIKEYTKKELNFEFSSGEDFPSDIEKYALIIHCGGCMINEQQMKSRLQKAINKNIPIVNYGILISYMNGILKRSVEIFSNIL